MPCEQEEYGLFLSSLHQAKNKQDLFQCRLMYFCLCAFFSMIRLVILKCLCVPFPFDNLAILIVRVLYVSAFRSRSCWMMSGVRRNVKSCLRTERRVLPPLTHHNTHRLMKALQPGNCLILCYYAWQVILFSWVITGKD